ncbi:Triacylglycerol lipase precursor [Actinokineospora spheciospongiae]|uniref:Triacylglycerol lipase n=1 Tax=Actinokineospora spheciospongiae TaxID=909613 RepID=W7IW76_9PSEU|nr:dienelactone hydrolase family protein [Actinokineospora spheciospongiae]EWC60711.1 Triacylglycerol lipase precursor [Actinokineospora spheciospongiae]PWW64468.1 putative dienelactone hydrolase [Actinokineospora spheciospongiae]
MRISKKIAVAIPAALAIAGAGVVVAIPDAGAAQTSQVVTANPHQRGPDPTPETVRAPQGTFAFSTYSVPASVTGFGQGTIYYPDDTTQGTFAGVAISPGYTGPEASVAWLGPRLASRGFVVITITTNSRYDQPTSRGKQLLAALDYLTKQSPTEVRQRLDATRLGVMGHSMGGGGALYAAYKRPSLKAAVPLAPWNLIKNWSGIRVPTLVVAGTADKTASAGAHSLPFYSSMTGARERAFADVTGADHLTFVREDPVIGALAVSWLKRFLDDDTRYAPFITEPVGLSRFLCSCPYAG